MSTMKSIKLSNWAKNNGYTYHGAYLAYRRGAIAGAYKSKSGAIMVKVNEELTSNRVNVAYARVSSSQNKANLDTQIQRVKDFMVASGNVVDAEFKDIGSGLNEKRRGLLKILEMENVTLFVEHKDRLTRFGFTYIEKCIEAKGGEIVVINKVDDEKDDIIQDFVSIVTSFCARLYGNRRSKRKTEKMIEVLNEDDNSII